MKSKQNDEKFVGFSSKPKKGEFWMYPVIMDKYFYQLNGSEQKVLDFILRHTYGFGKLSDSISLSQLENGVGDLDKGTGLTHPTIIKSLRGLTSKGFITKHSDKKVNLYKLIVKDFNPMSKDNLDTINNNTIDINTINSYSFFPSNRNKPKPYYMGEEMRKKDGKWYVIPRDGGEWCEYADKEDKITWK